MRFKLKKSKNLIKNFFKVDKTVGPPDRVLMVTSIIIIVFGLAMLSSASAIESFRRFNDNYYLFFHQFFRGFVPGLVLFFFFLNFDYRRLRKYTVHFYVVAVILLILVFVPGLSADYSSAKSWINIFGLSFQPSEVVKLLFILTLAGWFADRGIESNRDFWNGLVPFGILLGIISGLILLQPDLGTLIVVAIIAFMIYFMAGGRIKHIIGFGLLCSGAGAIMIARAPYRAARLMTFLHPELDPQGIGYHINQAFLAIGAGGFWGLGFGQSRQKFAYLPEVIGDSIFAVIAEEVGFIFSALLIILFLIIFLRGLKIIQGIDDEYGKYIIIGVITWITFQAFLNIAAMVGLMPLTGIPLPFVSYGGTALMSLLSALGILLNVSKHAKQS